jgi:isoleucyl-tRNA synthetase
MSKSRGTAVDPCDVLNQQGADAFRWYLYTASPPENARRFSPKLVEEVVKNFTLTLWNVYSFFVTYANLDGWTPDPDTKPEYNPMDKWLLSSLNALIRDVTEAMENYDTLGCTRPVERFVNTLSKWYLRRSRRRFWKSESDSDKHAAYATLYEVLVNIAYLLAPTMPFISEELYQNLVRTLDSNAPDSVHMAAWPMFDKDLIDDDLNQEMDLVMRLASLGHAARNKAEIKVRQPLEEVAFSVGSAQDVKVIESYAETLSDELNVKQVRSLGQAGEVVSYSLNPLPRQLGSKYKELFPVIREVLLSMDAEEVAEKLLAEESIQIEVNGETLEILPEEIEIRTDAKTGLTVAQEGSYMAALKTDLTDGLIAEGLTREFVRRVQDFRKQAGFEISDRIGLYYTASDRLAAAIETHREYIMGEVLATEMEPKQAPKGAKSPDEAIQFEGEEITIGLLKT